MRNLLIIGLFIMALIMVQFVHAQTVEDVIRKYEEARGGKDKLNAIKSIYMEGAREMMGNEVTVKVTREQGKLSRTEFEMGSGHGFMLITDKEGWTMFSMRSTSPTALPAEAVTAMQTELDIAGPLVNYAAKGHKAELLGRDSANGLPCYKIKLTTSAGKEILFWIDIGNNLVQQSSQKSNGMGGRGAGAAGDVITYYRDYKAVDGIQIPHTIETKAPGGGPNSGTTTFDKVELNVPVDAKLYKPE